MSMMGRQDISATIFNIKSVDDEKTFVRKCQETTLGLKAHHFIDGTHFLHQEKREEVNSTMLKFLDEYKN